MLTTSVTRTVLFIQGNSHYGEYRGSSVLCKFIEDKRIQNMLLAVSTIHKGPNLGKRRFELIEQACFDVLKVKDETLYS